VVACAPVTESSSESLGFYIVVAVYLLLLFVGACYLLCMTTTPTQRRYDEIKRVTELFLDENAAYVLKDGITVKEICQGIETLRKLGRTERWDVAITTWKNLIWQANSAEQGSSEWKRIVHWALLEGSISAGHAA